VAAPRLPRGRPSSATAASAVVAGEGLTADQATDPDNDLTGRQELTGGQSP
jgi:hypothetical protein